jgi:hypothetical protein
MDPAPRIDPPPARSDARATVETDRRTSSIYRCYGFNLASDAEFTTPLPRTDGGTHLSFTLTETPPAADWRRTELTYASQSRLETGESVLELRCADEHVVVRFTKVSDYHLWPDRIVCQLLDPAHDFTVELRLLSLVFSVWLECRGIPALHASAVNVENRVAGFLSRSRGGKSSLAAVLLQRGHALLTDDILPVERRAGQIVGRPSFPQMRFWPGEADYFVGSHEHLPLAHPQFNKRRVTVGPGSFGRFCDRVIPLSAIYLPERRDGASVRIESVAPGQALIELVRHSFAAHLAEAMGLMASRFSFFAELVREVPVRHLTYPPGFQHLEKVCDAILEDVAALPGRSN